MLRHKTRENVVDELSAIRRGGAARNGASRAAAAPHAAKQHVASHHKGTDLFFRRVGAWPSSVRLDSTRRGNSRQGEMLDRERACPDCAGPHRVWQGSTGLRVSSRSAATQGKLFETAWWGNIPRHLVLHDPISRHFARLSAAMQGNGHFWVLGQHRWAKPRSTACGITCQDHAWPRMASQGTATQGIILIRGALGSTALRRVRRGCTPPRNATQGTI